MFSVEKCATPQRLPKWLFVTEKFKEKTVVQKLQVPIFRATLEGYGPGVVGVLSVGKEITQLPVAILAQQRDWDADKLLECCNCL